MAAAKERLSPGGTCLIRVPTVSSAVWQRYRTGWADFDAPRHLFLHSHKSLLLLCESVGLHMVHLTCDSDDFGYWVSELYKRDISLFDEATGQIRDKKSYFSEIELHNFDAAAAHDNAKLTGGRLTAYFEAAPANTATRNGKPVCGLDSR
jgi:hypothetical protein